MGLAAGGDGVSERGVFAVDRGIWDHPMFATKDPMSKREAWLWLLSEATWKEKAVFVDGKRIKLGRGQLAHSVRFMAEKFGWKKSKVSRFLDALKTDTMIGTDAGTGVTIITICNYDEYQRVSLPDRDSDRDTNRDTSGTRAGHERDKEEDRKYKKDAAPPGAPPDDPKAPDAELFDRGKKVLGKSAGGLIASLLKAKSGSIPLARAAIEQAATKQNPREYVGRIINGPRDGPVPAMSNGEPYPEGII